MAKLSVFDDVHLEWAGKRYTIKGDNMMGAINAIERHITLKELGDYGKRDTIPLAAVAQAYASVLRYAGASVQDAEVYRGMFTGSAAEKQQLILGAVAGLAAMMVPPKQFADLVAAGSDAPGKPNRRQRRAAARSSKRHSS